MSSSSSYGTRFRGTKVPSTVAQETENNDLVSDEEERDVEEGEEAPRPSKKVYIGRRHKHNEDDEDDDYRGEEDEEEDDTDDEDRHGHHHHYVGRKSQGRSPRGQQQQQQQHYHHYHQSGPAQMIETSPAPRPAAAIDTAVAAAAASSSDPFRALQELSWRSARMSPQPIPTGMHGIPQVPEASFLPAPPPLRVNPLVRGHVDVHHHHHGLGSPMGGGGGGEEEDDDDDEMEDGDDDDDLSKLTAGQHHMPAGDFGLVDDPNNRRNTWSAEEDKVLASLVSRYGAKKWGIIASHLPARNAKQCHQRWHYVLKPSISRNTWTEREDYIIFYYQRLLGNKWSQIAKYLPGRTGYAVRNRHSYLLKNFQRGVRPNVPAEHFAYGPPAEQQQQVLHPAHSTSDFDVPVLPPTSLSSPQDVLAHAVPPSTAPAAFTLSSSVWVNSPITTTRASISAAVPQLDPVMVPALGSSLTSLQDPNADTYAGFYTQPMRFHIPPQQLGRVKPVPPAAYMFTPRIVTSNKLTITNATANGNSAHQEQTPAAVAMPAGHHGVEGAAAGDGGHGAQQQQQSMSPQSGGRWDDALMAMAMMTEGLGHLVEEGAGDHDRRTGLLDSSSNGAETQHRQPEQQRRREQGSAEDEEEEDEGDDEEEEEDDDYGDQALLYNLRELPYYLPQFTTSPTSGQREQQQLQPQQQQQASSSPPPAMGGTGPALDMTQQQHQQDRVSNDLQQQQQQQSEGDSSGGVNEREVEEVVGQKRKQHFQLTKEEPIHDGEQQQQQQQQQQQTQ